MHKTSAGGNAISFYAGLKLDKKLNPAMKTYVQVCKEQELKNEEGDVKSLLEWERSVLTEVDAKYDPDDDSEDEEKIARKKAIKAKADALKAQQVEEAKQAAPNKGKK